MSTRQILVTGASGYIGHAVAMGLAEKRDASVYKLGGPHSHTGQHVDVSDIAAVQEAVGRVEPDVIVHCAALTVKAARQMRRTNPQWSLEDIYRELYRVNVEGTRNLIQAGMASDNEILFIFVSSAEVYEYNIGTYLSERSPLISDTVNPQRAFARTKIEAEQLVQEAGGVVLRFNNAYGSSLLPGGTPRYLIDSAVDAFNKGISFKLGNPHGSRNYVDLRDVANTVSWVMAGALPGAIYNIAGPDTLTNLDALKHIAEAMGCPSLLDIQPFDPKVRSLEQESQSLVLDTSKARQYGWEPKYPFAIFLEEVQRRFGQ